MSQSAVESRSPKPSAEPTAPTSLMLDVHPQPPLRTPHSALRTPTAPPDRLYHIILLALCSSVLLVAAMLSVRDRSDVVIPVLQLPVPELSMLRRLVGY